MEKGKGLSDFKLDREKMTEKQQKYNMFISEELYLNCNDPQEMLCTEINGLIKKKELSNYQKNNKDE